jgi:hypothetical protein
MTLMTREGEEGDADYRKTNRFTEISTKPTSQILLHSILPAPIPITSSKLEPPSRPTPLKSKLTCPSRNLASRKPRRKRKNQC